MTWPILWVKKIPLQVWLLLGGVILFLGYSYWLYNKGQQNIQDKWDAAIARGKPIVAQLKEDAKKVNVRVETVYVDRVKVIREKGDTIIKEVTKYIPASTPDLPGGFRLLHDAAATSRFPSETELPGAPVSVRDATETIALNYERCLIWQTELQGWDQWYQDQYQAWQEAQRKLQE